MINFLQLIPYCGTLVCIADSRYNRRTQRLPQAAVLRGRKRSMARIVFIGAGSVEPPKNVLSDIPIFPEPADSTPVLYGIAARGDLLSEGGR
ncbi:hypothetical protein SAMN05216275_108270 [Streptosporangium canum]|uniref:Uncharacterized protein n=2 Tax=Streptosporangiaceae TaxID=2004 RepID=A0A1I3R6M1_9ACTN|nr:hypothetical protein SAMN05216275_108270 [Streptosporangium canum]